MPLAPGSGAGLFGACGDRRPDVSLRTSWLGPQLTTHQQEGSPLLLHAMTAAAQTASVCANNAKSCSDLPWLDTGDNSWQLTAATFVGLMSVPGLALLYAGLVPKKWVVNTMFMAFSGFALVLVVWVLWALQDGLRLADRRGQRQHRTRTTTASNFFKNFFNNFVGHPETSLRGRSEISQAVPADRHGRAPRRGRRRRCSTSSSCSPPSPRCCSSAACSGGSRSRSG